MAAVYRARDDNGTRVAVKVLHPESIKPDEVKRFQREFEALSRMNHPNIVRVYEAGLADGCRDRYRICRWDEPWYLN